ncbi:hypothetical protein ACOME3_000503 [Neoechinorhynchus agilis]
MKESKVESSTQTDSEHTSSSLASMPKKRSKHHPPEVPRKSKIDYRSPRARKSDPGEQQNENKRRSARLAKATVVIEEKNAVISTAVNSAVASKDETMVVRRSRHRQKENVEREDPIVKVPSKKRPEKEEISSLRRSKRLKGNEEIKEDENRSEIDSVVSSVIVKPPTNHGTDDSSRQPNKSNCSSTLTAGSSMLAAVDDIVDEDYLDYTFPVLSEEEEAEVLSKILEPRCVHRLSADEPIFGPIELPNELLLLLLADRYFVRENRKVAKCPCHPSKTIEMILTKFRRMEFKETRSGIEMDTLKELCLGMRVMFDDMVIDLLMNDCEKDLFKTVIVATGQLYIDQHDDDDMSFQQWPVSPATIYGGIFMIRMLVMLNKYAAGENVIRTRRSTHVLKVFIQTLIGMLAKRPELCASEYVEYE